MRVVLSTEAATGPPPGVYHLLDDDESKSLCGTVNADSLFGIEPCTILPREDAERKGFDPCKRCLRASVTAEQVDLQQFDDLPSTFE